MREIKVMRGTMKTAIGAALVLLLTMVHANAADTAAGATDGDWSVPRMPWGAPDMQGIWTACYRHTMRILEIYCGPTTRLWSTLVPMD